MSGDNTNARLLSYVDVYIAPIGTALPATIATAFSGSWLLAGHISDDMIEVGRDWGADDDFFSIEGVLVASVKGQYKETISFGFLEDNATTRGIIFPGSSDTAILTPVATPVLLALDMRFQSGAHERLITKKNAVIDVEGWTWGQELTKFPAVAKVFPDATVAGGQLWVRQFTAPTALPVITSALPASAAAGAQITITGSHFTGTTAATIGGVSIPTRTIVNDATLVLLVPAGSAGSAPIIVTNATGASDAFPYTRT